ncbi:hypothetical protein K491DRAFT_693822 [Lophiostoma macrostomum CBS 122681]|uniref:Uncharacterized protein n=1 Tax=Lophiostoma macrostomum CBS 122681 TaxID=1314788 RepID=A0A6A6T5F2_9PLEO|nr:hypothetical protein K491DRAFT_693822 [Lophiostoma macrostomum CBS 122681]
MLTRPYPANTSVQALQLEISQGKIFSTGFRVGAFLLKTVEYRSTCQTYNTDALHLSLDHVFVAELAGLPNLSDLSNIGLKIAVSPRSERIAIASWKTVKVWALDPLAFLDPEYSLDGDDGVPEDYAFLDGPGWRYYSCGDIQRDCVLLEPIELPSTGVVYDLGFRGENELWGCCERGLVRWNIGPNARQRREVNELP